MTIEQELAMSKTLELLYHLSQKTPCVIATPDEFKTALATSSMDMVFALDNGKIHFDDEYTEAMFHAVLTMSVDFCMNGKLKTSYKEVRAN